MARRVLAWECKYCKTLKKTENTCIRHEKTCLSNPDSKNCILCIHSYYETEEYNRGCRCKIRNIACSRAVSANCEHFKNKYGSDSLQDVLL